MTDVATIGLDIAKNIFQVYGADAEGRPVFNRTLRRAELLPFLEKLQPCLVGMEACATAQHWGRCIADLGHQVRLIPAQYVKPFVKRGKNDANDAEAIEEALTRPTMRFVPLKSVDVQAAAMLFRTRTMLVHQKVQAGNALRSHLAELGLVANRGKPNLRALLEVACDDSEVGIPDAARFALQEIVSQIEILQKRIDKLDHEILVRAKRDKDAKRLMTIPGVGPMIAEAVRTLAPDPGEFKSARHFAAWIGLTPKSHSSGGNEVLGRISKMGNRHLRSLLVVGAMAVLHHSKVNREGALGFYGLSIDGPSRWLLSR